MSDKGNLLSSEELEALRAEIGSGALPVDTGYNDQAAVRKHDLTNEDSSLGVNVTSLDMINERFIRVFRLGLLEVLRTSPKVTPQRVQLMKYGDYMKELQPPLSVNVTRMNPLRGSALILVDTNVIFTSLDNFFGGVGRGIGTLSPGRLFTPTEIRVINLILSIAFKSLKEAWQPLLPLEFEQISAEINPQFAQIADENDLVIINHFDAECGDSKGFIDIVYPYSALKPIRDLLRNRVQPVDADEESERRWRTGLAAAIGDALLQFRVELGHARTTVNALNEFKVNDIVYFKKNPLARALINEIPAFDAIVGTMGPNVAVRVEKLVELGSD
jgi:flagellar motor switch protein FliM